MVERFWQPAGYKQRFSLNSVQNAKDLYSHRTVVPSFFFWIPVVFTGLPAAFQPSFSTDGC